ncbi:MAG: efflux transporter outer membrane subunit [Xylophilus ampelinus]
MKNHRPDTASSAPADRAPGGAWLYLGTLALALGLTACANMGGIAPHAQLRAPASVGLPSAATGMPDEFPAASTLDAQWWRGFGDPRLDGLVERALAGNPSLRLAQARIDKAQAQVEAADANGRPRIDGQLDATRQHFSGNYIYPAPLGGSTRDIADGQVRGTWELDFFGRNRAALDASVGAGRAAEADAQAARVLLAANVVRGYVQLSRLQAQLAVAERTLQQRDETLRIVRDRVDAGLDTRLELRQSEGGLPEARQQIEALREQIALGRNALGALVGDPRSAQDLQAAPLETLRNPGIPARLPADLLGRRADIVAARWRIEAADRDIAYAKTQFYPNINLVAFAGLSSLGLDNFIDGRSRQWGIGPAIRLPIFEAGRLRANLRGRTADYDAAVESYNGSLVDAVREVADQVASSQSVVRQQQEQRNAQAAAESAYDIARQRYQAGLGTYLQVLTAETGVLVQRRQAVDLAARALDAQVGLARALGGGYVADAAAAAVPAGGAARSAAVATAAVR